MQDFSDSGMDQGSFMDGMGHGSGGGDGYRRSGLLDQFQGSRMGSSLLDRPSLLGAAPESTSLPHTLLSYLVGFLE